MMTKLLFCFLICLKLVLPSSAGYKATGEWAGQKAIDKWCEDNCPRGYCPASHCVYTDNGATEKPTTPGVVCRGTKLWRGVEAMNKWCAQNCHRGFCPSSLCVCLAPGATEKPTTQGVVCKAVGQWKGQKGVDSWCEQNCARGNCPASHCACVGPYVPVKPTTTLTAEPTENSTGRPQETESTTSSLGPQTTKIPDVVEP